MAKEMKTKFEKYWDTYSMILSFAVILDPRYKMKIIEYCFDKLGMVGEMLSDKVGSIESGLRKLYNGYQVRADAIHDLNLATSQNVAVENPSDYLDGFESFRSRYDNVLKEKSQLDKYLEEPPLDRFQHPNLNILQYWKENQGRYPELAQMARDILSIPITTVASESSFSIGGRIISKYRSLLLSDNVEALLCTRDWIFDQEGEGEDILKMDKQIEKRLIEDIEKFMDFLDEEQHRAINMRSSSIALKFNQHFINLIDSLGHMDFCSEVSTASRLSNGGLVLVDAVKGVHIQTHAVLRQAWIEKVTPCLVLNKIDRLILELKLTPLEAYAKLLRIVEKYLSDVDSIIQSGTGEMGDK
ncbi:zinc finger BED domain-containing protein RICESLEEPER 2-like protein [Tanacetum coccineum]